MLKAKTFATVVVLICSLVLASSSLRADQGNDWYQGRQGQWIQQQNAWRFRDTNGNEYRQSGNVWQWFNALTQNNDWYQGRQGQWTQQQNAWRFRDVNGNEYRQSGNQWRWYNGRAHGEEGAAYHNRAPGNTQNYNQYQNTH